MSNAVSPLIIRLLLHYHHIAGPYDHPSSAATADTKFLLNQDMIYKIKGDVVEHYHTTKKGDAYIEHLLNTPFPLTEYKIIRRDDLYKEQENGLDQ